jgi:hypothetical protein
MKHDLGWFEEMKITKTFMNDEYSKYFDKYPYISVYLTAHTIKSMLFYLRANSRILRFSNERFQPISSLKQNGFRHSLKPFE